MTELDTILDDFAGSGFLQNIKENPDEYIGLFEDRFQLADLSITARVLSHWKDLGLLPEKDKYIVGYSIGEPNKGEGKSKKRGAPNKFNFFELIYLYMLEDLREIGVSLSKLQMLKSILLYRLDYVNMVKDMKEDDIKSLSKHGFKDEYIKIILENRNKLDELSDEIPESIRYTSVLSNLILNVLVTKTDIRVIISKQGNISFDIPNTMGQIEKSVINSETHITIPLYTYLNRFLSNEKYKDLYVPYKLLNDQELFILGNVRKGKYKEIKIRFNKNKSILLELTEERKVDNAARLQDILLKGQYQELRTRSDNGTAIYSTLTTTVKK